MNITKLSTYLTANFKGKFNQEKYGITPAYNHRKEYTYLDKTESTDEWQKEVYEYAQNFMLKNNYKKVVDFGCGSGFKMMKYFQNFESVGVEVEETYKFLVENHPDQKWYNADKLNTEILETDLVICADVIEHVLNPDEFLDSLNKIKFKHLIISTPDRLTLHGSFHFGPPKNPFHIREWTCREFRKYLSKYYRIELQQITNFNQATQMVVCTKK
ncbi:MAG TPA: methyltransferase domain-containing protein [Moheibacter sp.]|nr:methyltransferase domain-containing protein [Moheibacter sp.]